MPEAPEPSPRVAIVGAAFSANKGAASMLYAVLDVVGRRHPGASFDVLTTYPKADTREVARSRDLDTLGDQDVRIVDLSPRTLVVSIIMAVLVRITSAVRLPNWFLQHPKAIRALMDANIVIDVAGISFVDGRGIPLLGYNTLMTGLPLLLGRPTVKASQALGPFEQVPTKLAAKLVLPRLKGIGARGASTRDHLDGLGLSNAFDAADLAFSMDHATGGCHDELPSRAEGEGLHVVVMPSAVVEQYCDRIDLDYLGIMAAVVDSLTQERGCSVTLAPHSFRENGEVGRMNDGPTVAGVSERLTAGDRVTVINESLDPRCLRELISEGDILITSRFHAMISALATSTPVLVVGWSHKYAEVLDQFDVAEFAIAYGDLSSNAVLTSFDDVAENREAIVERIGANLPSVQQSSARSFDVIDRVLSEVG